MPNDSNPTLFPALPALAGGQLRPLKICIASCEFIGPIRNGGIGTAYTAMAHALAEAGHDVTLLYTPGKQCENETIAHWESFYRRHGLKFVARPSDPDLRIDAPPHALRSYEIYRWLKQQDFDLVHVPEWGGDAYYSLLAKHQGLAFSRTLFCVGTHSPTAWLKQANSEYYSQPRDLELDFMERQCVALADVVVSPCQYMLQWMTGHGFKLPAGSHVQQNTLPASARSPGSAGASTARQPVNELVFFGRLETRKGIELFCDALDRIAKEPAFQNLRITFMGKPATVSTRDSRVYIRERAAAWSWQWSIVSDLDQPGAMRYLKQPGRLAVIPSLMENSPYTVLECLGSRIPFLASRVGGIPELIAPEDVELATFAPVAADLAELLRKTLQSGERPWKPAMEPSANEAAWVAWHAGLAAKCSTANLNPAADSERPLVSVCVAHFNRPKFLKQALASLEAQDYPNFEVIVVDDGSTQPDAIEYLASIEPKFQQRNWRIVRQENRYLSAARNTGARHAQGEYLLFMDDDNFAKSNELTTFVNVARHTGADVVTACMDYFEGTQPPSPQARPVTRWVPLGPEPAAGYFRNCFGDANFLIKRGTFERLGGFTEVYGVTHEDWEFLANAVLKGCHLEMIPEALFHYRYLANSMIRSTSQYRNHMRHIRPYLDLVPPALHPVLLMAQGSWVEQSQGRGIQHFFSQHTLQWRSQFEAARTLAKLGHKKAAVDQFMAGLKAAEASTHPMIILEALLEIGRELRSLDSARAKDVLQLAAQLGDNLKRPEATRAAKAMLADLASGNVSNRRTGDTTVLARKNVPAQNHAAPVSIVIPTFNRLDLTRACLKAIQTHTPAGQCEVIVVDNASTDGTREFLANEQRAGRLTAVLNDANGGFARACNQGAASAQGKYVLFLNNDTEVKPGWLEPLIRTLDADPRIGAVGSKLLFPDATIQHAGVVLLDDRKHGDPLLAQHIFHRKPQDLPEANRPMLYQALTAACLLVRKELFREISGFDEEYWNGYEDVDLCFKIRAAGRLLVYQPASTVVHHESQSGPERFRNAQQNIARLHNKWLKHVQPDYILNPDGAIAKAGANRIAAYALPSESTASERCAASIIILAFNQIEHTRKCLESIAAHTPEPHEVIVVDNGSTDGTQEFLKQWQAAHSNCAVIRNSTNRGFAAGNNQGLSVARGEQVVLLNNDTVVTSGWLAGLLNVLTRHPETGLVGPMSNCVSGPQLASNVGYQDLSGLPAFAAEWARAHHQQSEETGRAVGFCLLARREVIDRVGGLDEQFGSGNFEDDDLCIRARLAGFHIRIAKDVFIHHTGSQTFKGERMDYRQAMLRNWDLFRAKWKLPADTVLERGYPIPKTLPEGVALNVPLASLSLTHKSGSDRTWVEETKNEPAAPRPNTDLPAVATLGNLDEARTRCGRRDFAGAWSAALAAIQIRSFHPEAFLLLAEIALAAGDSTAARQCAHHARDLAPNWKAAKQFLQKPLKGDAHPDWLQLPESIRNPQSASGAATGIRNRLTVCIIAKNEERFLGQCLKSVQAIAQQIIVVDTGSNDRTVEIAKSHGAEVFHLSWSDDFSAARNAALEHATGDWILVLDADEELTSDQHGHLQADLKTAGAIGHRLPLTNAGQEDGFSYVPRLFRNAPGVYYYGRIHEQVFPSLMTYCKAWGLETRLGTAQLLHHGYAKEIVRDRNKNERNLRLLLLAVTERPNDPNLLMNLGLELVRSGDLPAGLDRYREAFRLMSAQTPAEVVPELREALLTQFTCHLYKVREHQEIVRALNSPLAKNGGLTASLHFALGLAQFELQQYRESADQMRQCLVKRKQTALSPINTDILTSAPNHCLALSLAQLGDSAAGNAFEAALTEKGRAEDVKLDYAKFLARQNPVDALHKLHEIVAQNTKNIAAWRCGGEIALKRPEFLEFGCDWTGEAIRCLPEDPVIVAQRAEALLLSQQTTAAKPLWERVCNGARPPHALAALILCAAADSEPLPRTNNSAEETVTSKAFVGWYQRLLAANARETILRLNSQVDALRTALPTAAQLLDSALVEAEKQPA